jgi:regulator of protease activity HflC (stomatin/prohibitin superfamily)
MDPIVILFVFMAVVLVFVAATGFRIVRPYEKGLVEVLGKYEMTVDSGLRWVMPFVKRLLKVDMREQVVDVPPQEVITKDNVVVTVDAVIYYEPTDPVKLLYNVGDFILAVTKLAQTNLRNVVGDLQLDDALISRELINAKLREILDDATDKWGSRVVRVEIQRIEPPPDVTDAMHRQMKAERLRRAVVTEAEGEKRSAILRAEGVKQKQILEAEGEAEAIKRVAEGKRYEFETVAEGEGRAIERVFGAIHTGDPTPDLIAIRYLDALQGIADGQATKLFLPLEVTGVLGSLGAIREVFGTGDGGSTTPAPPSPSTPPAA